MGDTILQRDNPRNQDSPVDSPSKLRRSKWSLIEVAAFWGIVSQFAIYFAGLEPIAPVISAGPVIVLAGIALVQRRIVPHWLAFLWLASMVGVLVQMIAVFWMKGIGGWYIPGWLLTFALAAFLPIAGAMVRPSVVFSASAILGVQALVYTAIAGTSVYSGFDPSYPSPLPISRLTDPSFHVVRLTQPPEVAGDEKRLIAFTPFPTSGGAAACMFALLTLGYRRSWTKGLSMTGWISLILLTRARTSIICTALGIPLYYLLRLPRRYLFLSAGIVLLITTAFSGPILRTATAANEFLRAQRSSSSQDRANLRGLAMDGWWYGEHTVMGAGASVRGGPIVRDVGIGTHDWVAANLFVRGALGFGLTLLPVAVTLVFGFFGGYSPGDRIVTTVCAALLTYTYSQELQTLYVHIWPIFLLIGAICLRSNPQNTPPLAKNA